MPRKSRKKPDWKPKFITALALSANVGAAAKSVGVSRGHVYRARRGDAEFNKQFNEARKSAADVLEAEAWRRAVDGIEEPVHHKGEQCGVIRRYSDGLMAKLLSGYKPRKYANRSRIEVDGELRVAGIDPDELRLQLLLEMRKLLDRLPHHIEPPDEIVELLDRELPDRDTT